MSHLLRHRFALSIHAPTRGATTRTVYLSNALSAFNPRSYKRSDKNIQRKKWSKSTFNPRSYKRSDGNECRVNKDIWSFNPRSYKRSDVKTNGIKSAYTAFNPRSYKRSDVDTPYAHYQYVGFQSTLLQEERQQKCTIFLMHLCNNYCIVSI